jgi:DUF1680 family protein
MTIKVEDRFGLIEMGKVQIEGYLGDKLNTCIHQGVMAANFSLYHTPFQQKTDDKGSFGGEFWGKWFTSAVLAYRYQPTKQHGDILFQAVEGLLKAQEENGRLSSASVDFASWDIWGRKYALLGLVAYYDHVGAENALHAACRAVDAIIEVAGPGKQKLTETGLSLLEALSSCSILEPIVLIYQRSGEEKYLDFAKYLVSLWSEPNLYTDKGIRLIEDALDETDPVNISSPKGYEMMSCYEGLCELYRVTGDQSYLDAVLKFAHKVREKEIMIVGSGSSGELWCDGKMRQTEMLEQPMETCVTATWTKLCFQLLRLTGDPVWAEEMEFTLYNALLGAMVPQGNWWAYFSPLIGEKVPSPMQVPLVQSSCCSVNGPRGLLIAPWWSVMTQTEGLVVNLYHQGICRTTLADGTEVVLKQSTTYPEQDQIRIEVQSNRASTFTLSLRIPSWSKRSCLTINGEEMACTPGAYLHLEREWQDGDQIALSLDLRGRVITAPGSINTHAIMRGPIVLTLDNRLVDEEEALTLWLHHDEIKWKHNEDWDIDYVLLEQSLAKPVEEVTYIELTPAETKPEGVWLAFDVPFFVRPTHFVKHRMTKLTMCDYASAGNQFNEHNLFRVWLPQPIYIKSLFPKDTWHLHAHTNERPRIPDANVSLKQSGLLSL